MASKQRNEKEISALRDQFELETGGKGRVSHQIIIIHVRTDKWSSPATSTPRVKWMRRLVAIYRTRQLVRSASDASGGGRICAIPA